MSLNIFKENARFSKLHEIQKVEYSVEDDVNYHIQTYNECSEKLVWIKEQLTQKRNKVKKLERQDKNSDKLKKMRIEYNDMRTYYGITAIEQMFHKSRINYLKNSINKSNFQ